MNPLYKTLESTGYRLIASYGVECEIRGKPISGGFHPETGLPMGDLEPISERGRCLVLNYSTALENMPDSLVKSGQKKILISATGISKPQPEHTIKAGGITYRILEVKDVDITNLNPIIYEVKAVE